MPHPGGQEVAKMPGSVARLLPRLRPSGTSPLFLLLLLALLRGPVCGRVPHSVPRTSLPISGKARAPSPLALGSRPRSRLQVPRPTFRSHPGSRTPRPHRSVHGFLRCPCLVPMQAGPPRGAAPHPTGCLGSYGTPRRRPLSFICAAASHSVDADTEAQGGEWGLPGTVHFQVSSPYSPLPSHALVSVVLA